MLHILWYCSECKHDGIVNDLTTMYGQCPVCGCHHGELEYICDMTQDDFISVLSQMSEKEISRYAYAIQLCAEQISMNK